MLRNRWIISLSATLLLLCTLTPGGSAEDSLRLVPLTRNDSARIRHNDSVFTLLMAQGTQHEAARALDQNAMVYWKHNYLKEAEDYFIRSREINRTLGNQHGVAGINSNLAFIYADWREYEKAYDYFEQTLAVRRSEGEPVGIISTLVNESVVLNHLRRYKVSLEKLEEALTLARQMNDELQMRSVYGMLAETHQKAGDVEKSLYYYNYYRTFNDYVTQQTVRSAQEALYQQQLEEKNLRLENQNKELELERQRALAALQNRQLRYLGGEASRLEDSLTGKTVQNRQLQLQVEAQQLANNLLEMKRNRAIWVTTLLTFELIFAGAGILLLLRLLRQRNRHNEELARQNTIIREQAERISQQNASLQQVNEIIEGKNQEMLSSIRYSKQVQAAMLGHGAPLNAQFQDAFSLNLPLKMVSGDFYYCRTTHTGRKLLAVGDCTGHGVPGAFLTIYTHSILERALNEKVEDPGKITRTIDEGFNLINAKNTVALHSCEIAICLFDYEEKLIHFAGSKNGIVVCNPGQTAQHVRGSRNFIGQRSMLPASSNETSFPTSTLPMVEGQWIYLFSDGFKDQVNPRHEKFSTQRFLTLLQNSAGKEATSQEALLLQELQNWQQGAMQIDDILVVGVRTL